MLKVINAEHYEKELVKARENGSIENLEERLEYLNQYSVGGHADPERTIVELGWDFAGFSLLWKIRQEDGEYKPWINGGLIYHDSDNSWSVHT